MANLSITSVTQIEKYIKAGVTKDISYPITGHKGLELRIRPNGKAEFRHRYTHPITGKRPYMTLGSYPAFTLAQAKKAYNDNLALLAKNIDPIEYRQAEKQREINERKNTLDYFIAEWQAIQKQKKLAPDTYRKQRDNIAYIQKGLGNILVTDIKPATVIDFVSNIQKEHPYKGLEVKGVLTSILQIALSHRVIESNPAHNLAGTLKPHKQKHYPSLANSEQDFARLMQDIDRLPATKDYLKEIMQLIALTFVRRGDVCAMKWSDINFLTKQWIFRPQKAGSSEDMTDLVTPLAPQAMAILERMKTITGGQEYVFYHPTRKLAKHTDPQRLNSLLNNEVKGITLNDGQSYRGLHTPHGFRSVAKTMLKRMLKNNPLWRDMTELQLGHKVTDRYGGAYDRWDILSERILMMNKWANYLDQLKAGKVDNILFVDFNNAKQQAVNE